MNFTRTARSSALLIVVAALIAACGSSGSSATASPAASAAAPQPANAASAAPAVEDTANATEAAPTEAPTTNANGGGGSGDVEAAAKALVPPNSTETMRTTAVDTSFVIYESTDSIASLKSYYESAIPRAGLHIYATTEVNGGVSFGIATDDSGSFGGAVNIYPSGNGSNSAVQVTVGKTN